ncbi:hypothetical protein FOA52_002768 [Chlamydomonas sp. UWO 241]|nr:hypothetical protein FOA52_002768 [Chlamydomonas sp. UWO 241]
MHSDVRLHVRVSAPSSAPPGEDPGPSGRDEPASKRRRGLRSDLAVAAEVAVPSTTSQHARYVRSFHAHAIILATQSEYFKGRLGQDSSRFTPDAVEGGSSGSRIVSEIVEVVEEEADVEAMDAVLRTMYGATVATDVLLLLRASRLADRFLPALLERFLALPHAAVVAWAKFDSLQVHNENEVVYLLSVWVKSQETAGCPCSAEQLEQLVQSVRLADCGPSYVQSVVPELRWFKSGLEHLGKVGKAARRGPSTHIAGPDGFGFADLLLSSAASVTVLVAPHLDGGQLKGKVNFSDMDLMDLRA